MLEKLITQAGTADFALKISFYEFVIFAKFGDYSILGGGII